MEDIDLLKLNGTEFENRQKVNDNQIFYISVLRFSDEMTKNPIA